MSVPVLAHAALTTLRVAAPTIADSVRGTLDVGVCNDRLDWWARTMVDRAHISLTVEGRAMVPEDETFVVMSNHQSHYDIPCLFVAYRRPLRMVAKKELFRVPIWGRAMRLARFVELDRSNRERAIASLDTAKDTLKDGVSIWIAPEGTRSRTGKLGPFKKGGFRLALETNTRILPVTVDGTRDALLAKGFHVTLGAKVRVTFGPPINTSEYGMDRRAELVDAVRDAIARPLPYA